MGNGMKLLAGMFSGVAVLVAGMAPATGGLVLSSQSFTINVTDPQTLVGPGFGQPPATTTGTFSGNQSDPTSFLQFDTLGGTRVLNSVVITVPASTALLTASVDCDPDDNFSVCIASAQNVSTFSVGVDAPTGGALEFNLLPLTQQFSTSTITCIFCEDDSTSSSPAVGAFGLTLTTPADLNAFIGSGSFNVDPLVSLSGAFSASNDNNTDVSASTDWNGTIQVTFNFTEATAAVSEPASVLLLAAGLAGLGFARRRRPTR